MWFHGQPHTVNINWTWWTINNNDLKLRVRWIGGSQGELGGESEEVDELKIHCIRV